MILSKAQAGDVVLLAGKGAEKYQEVKGKFIPFDEVDIAVKKMADMGYEQAKSVEEN